MKPTYTFTIVLVSILSSCQMVGPNYKGAQKVSEQKKFSGSNSEAAVVDKWWRKLGSSELNNLVDQALVNNHDIAISGERLREARAMRQQAGSALLPKVNGNLGFDQLNPGSITGGDDTGAGFLGSSLKFWSAGLDVSWEADVFGGSRRAVRGAVAREQATQEALHGVRLAVAAEVVETYFTIATMREQLRVVNEQIKLQQSQVDDIRVRVEAGALDRLSMDRGRVRLESTRSQLPGLDAGIQNQLRRLSLLLGKSSSALAGRQLEVNQLPSKLPMTRTGIPAQLTLRRPDLREAERELAAATEDIGVAVSRFYPRFSIGGGPSNYTGTIGDLFKPSDFVMQYSPRVSWSLFSGGENRAILEMANSRQRVAVKRYEKSVLDAVGEVENELENLRAEKRKLEIVQRAYRLSASAVSQLRAKYKAGAIGQSDVLIEEERLREMELTETRIKSQMLQVWIRLQKALGGGWE